MRRSSRQEQPGLRSAALLLTLIACAVRPAAGGDFAVAAEGGYFDLAATQSAKAIFGSAGGPTLGAGLSYRFGNGFYVAAGARYFRKDGERAFAAEQTSPSFRLGHPLSLRLLPVAATVGYRLRRDSALVPYLGLGFGFASYHEESEIAGEVDSLDQTKASGHVLAGLEVGRGALRFGVELAYSTVPDALGLGGISKVYDEKDAGGLSVVGRVAFVFGSR